MVEVKNLTKTFGGFTALKELNMTIPRARSTDWWVPTARANPA